MAFVLVENSKSRVLLIQRAYGRKRGKWSLPGGFCDRDSYAQAAVREAREETGLHVKVVSTVLVGSRHRIKTFFARMTGGRLRPQKGECLDARYFRYKALPPLAFLNDQRAIAAWQEMKRAHAAARDAALPRCSHCGSSNTRLRRHPHNKLFRCRSCGKAFCNHGSLTSL